MNKKKNCSKGFTLTELIIVIVIIGILAAVLIPTITQYVERARLSNDKSDARNMTMLLSIEAYDLDMDYFDSSYVIGFMELNGYNLKARAKGYNFCYDFVNNKIEVLSLEEMNLAADDQAVLNHPSLNNPLNRMRNVYPGYTYIDKGNSELASAVDTVVNLLDLALGAATNDPASKMKNLFDNIPAKYQSLFNEFDPDNTLYVSESGYYTTNTTENYTNVVIAKNTVELPSWTDQPITVTNPIYIPSSVSVVTSESVFEAIAATLILNNPNVLDSNLNIANITTQNQPNNHYTNYNLQHVVIKYQISFYGQIVQYDQVNYENNNVPLCISRGDGSGKFVVDFASVNIKEGSSIDIKHNILKDEGCYLYDVRIFDKSGVLYARGQFKYIFDSLTVTQ